MGAAAAVILRAFHERPNFYSAAVYLGQSTACRMILLNMLLLTLATSMYGLQRLLYGPLRAIEIEQLWDKAWYAITETALAMTTFRDEVGGYFFLMFMTLLGGKVWGWIGEGRVETMEQQPPANPKTFYARLTTSLVLSELFDLLMLRYCVRSILDQRAPRAGMMIMFVFEFAILAISSASTLSRYGLALWERWVIKQQMQTKIEERREEIRVERARIPTDLDARAAAGSTLASSTSLEHVEVDENEIDVPGWQEKGKWVLFLDLTTGIYTYFNICSIILTYVARFPQTCILYDFLSDSHHLCWNTYSHVPRPLHYDTLIPEANQRLLKIPKCDTRHELKIPRCNSGRAAKRWHMHHLPRRNETVADASRSGRTGSKRRQADTVTA